MLVGGASRAVIARQKKEIRRQIEADLREKGRAILQALRQKIHAVKAMRKDALRDAVGFCRAERARAKERAKELRARAREELKAAILQDRLAARSSCTMRKAHVKTSALSEQEKAREGLRAEKAYQQEIRRIDQRRRSLEKTTRRQAKEREQESDDEVRGNLPPELLPLWEKTKRQFRATDRMSRTEAFLHYAEENPSEVIESQAEIAEAEIRRMMKQEAKLAKAVRRPKPPSEAELAAIPF